MTKSSIHHGHHHGHRAIEPPSNQATAGDGGGNGNDDEKESHTFTMLNAFWFMIASLLQQGTDILPR